MEPVKTQSQDDRDVSRYNLPLGKIAAVVAVIVTLVWWAATLSAQVSAINGSLTAMRDDVAVAAGLSKDLEIQRDKLKELTTRYEVLDSRVDHLMAAERAREALAAARRE